MEWLYPDKTHPNLGIAQAVLKHQTTDLPSMLLRPILYCATYPDLKRECTDPAHSSD